MPKAVQLDLFTGDPIQTPPVEKKSERIAKTTQLALQVQLSIARMDKFSTTMKRVTKLCEQITGIAYHVDINERHSTNLQKRQQETNVPRNDAEKPAPKKRGPGRPKGTAGTQVPSKAKKDYAYRNSLIRQRHFQDGVSQTDLVRETGLSPTTISNIINQKGQQ